MKRVSCLILSLILAFSVGSVNSLAMEDSDQESLHTEIEEDIDKEDITQKNAEDEEADTSSLTTKGLKNGEDVEDEALPNLLPETSDLESSEEQNAESNDINLLSDNLDEISDEEWPEVSLPLLTYDDSYSLEDLDEISEASEEYVIMKIVSNSESFQVSEGTKTNIKDEVVTQRDDSLDILATGVGTAAIYLIPSDQAGEDDLIEGSGTTEDTEAEGEPQYVENGLKVKVTVEPATLTLMYLAGQSNMEGQCSSSTGYELDASIACKEGTVYSTYVPTTASVSKNITGISFSDVCNDGDNASDFVAESLQSDTSLSGKSLDYSLKSLTTEGSGKAGPDSGLAYEWNQCNGDKVWVINTAWSGTNIASWQPDASLYKRSKAVWDCVEQVYQAEIDAGHYNKGSKLAFWLQGESDASKDTSYYLSSFTNISSAMKQDLKLDALGIIMVRASAPSSSENGAYNTEIDLKMTGPRSAQYLLGGSEGLSDVYVVSNANEQWVSDSGVQSYFQSSYPSGSLDYPMQGSSKSLLPTTVDELHSDVHYSQIGHNENGISAAYGMWQALYGSPVPTEVQWRDENGKAIDSLSLEMAGHTADIIPVTVPAYAAKEISYSVSGDAVSYDGSTGIVTAEKDGTSVITASCKGNKLSQISISVSQSTDLSSVAGKNYTGIYYYQGTWWYLVNGIIQSNFEGVEKNENGWWYINKGKVDFTYTGFAQNSNGWWYIENGKVTFNQNSVIKDTNKKIDGTDSWWYVVGSKVQLDFTGLADYSNSNGWWYINNGKVTFNVETVAQNKNGWYYVKDSKVDFGYNGYAENSNGWWYIESGKVTFNKNSVIKGTVNGTNAWWYVVGSKVQINFTGLADYKNENGWWYIENGKVTFTANTVAKNTNGWYYVKDSKVDFGYNGYAQNSNGWWYLESGKVTFNKNSVIKGTVNGTNAWWYVVGSKVQTGFTGLANYKNENGWWYIKNGQVDFTANTVAKNNNGWYYVLDGKVQFGFTGLADYSNSNGWWYINDGKVTFNVNTVAKNKNGWWYVKGSKVDFSFNGISSNQNGSWYIQGGKVDFSYNGTCVYNGFTYTIVDGKVQN